MNLALNTAQRIQERRGRKNKPRLIKKDLSTVKRRPGIGSKGPVRARMLAKQVFSNVGTAVSGLQTQRSRIETGTEVVKQIQSGGVANVYNNVLNISLNPAEPSLAPSLAAVANQYQRFVTRGIRIMYTPAAATTVNGTLYVTILPGVNENVPDSIEAMTRTGNMRTFPIYGSAAEWLVGMQSIQQAYKFQTVDVKELANADTPLNSSGRLVVGVAGAPATTVLGTISWSYAYEFSNPKLTPVTSLEGTMRGSDFTAGTAINFYPEDLVTGQQILIPTSAAGVYEMRQYHCPHYIVLTTADDSAATGIEIAYSTDGGTSYTVIGAPTLDVLTSGVYTMVAGRIPRCDHLRLRNSSSTTLTASRLHLAGVHA